VAERRAHPPGERGVGWPAPGGEIVSRLNFARALRPAANDNRRALRDRLRGLWFLAAGLLAFAWLWAAGIR
jgi:hypothetical protein